MLKDTKYIKDLKARKFKSSGASCNDCWKPSAGASRADLKEWHREDLKLRRRRQVGQSTRLSREVGRLRKNGLLKQVLMNISHHPGGKKRTRSPIYN